MSKEELIKDLTELQKHHQQILGAIEYVMGKLRAIDAAASMAIRKAEAKAKENFKKQSAPAPIEVEKARLKKELDGLKKEATIERPK